MFCRLLGRVGNQEGWEYDSMSGRLEPKKVVRLRLIQGNLWESGDKVNIYTRYDQGVIVQKKELPEEKPLPPYQFGVDPHDFVVARQALDWFRDEHAWFEKKLGMSIPEGCSLIKE